LAVEEAVRETDVSLMIVVGTPPVFGSGSQTVNMLTNVFADFWGRSLIPQLADRLEVAIGAYEQALAGDGRMPSRATEVIDIESAVERSLRTVFRSKAPSREAEVQAGVETILNALGVAFTREMEGAPVGLKQYVPDFVLSDLDLAIEVKLTRDKRGPKEVQE